MTTKSGKHVERMERRRGQDLEGRTLSVAPDHRAANPRQPNSHGWLAFEVLRRSPEQQLSAAEYERRLFDPSPDIAALARLIPGQRDAYQNLKHIRCDISRGTVHVSPPLPRAWYRLARCGKKRPRNGTRMVEIH
jgi:hypothetical protein